jgi:hypothetical protein
MPTSFRDTTPFERVCRAALPGHAVRGIGVSQGRQSARKRPLRGCWEGRQPGLRGLLGVKWYGGRKRAPWCWPTPPSVKIALSPFRFSTTQPQGPPARQIGETAGSLGSIGCCRRIASLGLLEPLKLARFAGGLCSRAAASSLHRSPR